MNDDDDDIMDAMHDQLGEIIDMLADLNDLVSGQAAELAALKASVDELSADLTQLLAG